MIKEGKKINYYAKLDLVALKREFKTADIGLSDQGVLRRLSVYGLNS